MSINTNCSLRRLVTANAWIMSEVLNACPKCTFENHEELMQCEMCNQSLPTPNDANPTKHARFAFADSNNCDPTTVTARMLEASTLGIAGWNRLAARIIHDLEVCRQSKLTRFEGTADAWKGQLYMKFRASWYDPSWLPDFDDPSWLPY